MARQFGAFKRGFLRLCSGDALQMFRWVLRVRAECAACQCACVSVCGRLVCCVCAV